MRIFRSEEHLRHWLESGTPPRGESMSLDLQWELARRWYKGRHLPGWQRRTPEQAEEVFASLGLSGSFWRLRDE